MPASDPRLRRAAPSARRAPPRLRRLLMGAVLALGACARRGEVAPASPAASAEAATGGADDASMPASDAVLEVTNGSIYDVRIFVRGPAGSGGRLGLVTSGASASFALAPALVGREVRFFASPVGARNTQLTDPVLLRPGIRVRFGLEKQLRSHTLAFYY